MSEPKESKMNYTMGRYISELDAEGRDRLIGAPDFSSAAWWEGGCGCLVGTAKGARWAAPLSRFAARDEVIAEAGKYLGRYAHGRWAEYGPAYRFPLAVGRFGKARVVRAIKLRAARLNGCDAQTIAALLEQPSVKSRV